METAANPAGRSGSGFQELFDEEPIDLDFNSTAPLTAAELDAVPKSPAGTRSRGATERRAEPAKPAERSPAPAAAREVASAEVPSPPRSSTPASSPDRTSPSSDPFLEAPMANWYVRIPTGNQFGPARADIMRKWLAEGRISGDSYVWCEGWPDWQLAGSLFPNLPKAAEAAAMPSQPASRFAAPNRPISSASRPLPPTAPRGNKSFAIGVVALLTIVSIGLLAGLAYVIRNS